MYIIKYEKYKGWRRENLYEFPIREIAEGIYELEKIGSRRISIKNVKLYYKIQNW